MLGDDVDVTLTAEGFLAELDKIVPEVQAVVAEHAEDNGELLLHLLIADLRRFAADAFQESPTDVLERLLTLINRALVEGSEDIRNAVAVSIVEDTGWWDPAMQGFIESWPSQLKQEARRQKAWRPT